MTKKRTPTAYELEMLGDDGSLEDDTIQTIRSKEIRKKLHYYTFLTVFWSIISAIGYYIGLTSQWFKDFLLFDSNFQVSGVVVFLTAGVFAQGMYASGTKMLLPATAYSGGNRVLMDDINNARRRMFSNPMLPLTGAVLGLLLIIFG